MFKEFFITILIFLFGGTYIYSAQPYEDVLDKIKHYISEGSLEKNIAFIDSLSNTNLFNSFDCYQKGKIFHYSGVSFYLLNQESEAIQIFKNKALSYWENCNVVPLFERANTTYNIGVSYQYTNTPSQGKAYIDESLLYFSSDTSYDELKLANKFIGAGNFYLDLYDVTKSEAYFLSAISILERFNTEVRDQFDIYNKLTVLHIHFDQYKAAIHYLDKAIALVNQNKISIPQTEQAILMLNGATCYFHEDELENANYSAQVALHLIDPKENSFYYSIGLEILGSIKEKQNEKNEALRYYQEMLDLRKDNVNEDVTPLQVATAHENLSTYYFRESNFKKSLFHINESIRYLCGAINLDNQNNPRINLIDFSAGDDLIRTLSVKANILKQDTFYKLQSLRSLLFKIDTLINYNIVYQNNEASKIKLYDLIQKYYGNALGCSMDLFEKTKEHQYQEDAYYFSSRSKSLVLQNLLYNKENLISNLDQSIIEKEKTLENQLFKLEQKLSAGADNQDSLLQEYNKISSTFEIFLDTIEQKNLKYYAAKYKQRKIKTTSEIQNDLPSNSILIEFSFIENPLDTSRYIQSFWVTKTEFYSFRIKVDEALDTALKRFISNCRDPSTVINNQTDQLIYEKLLGQGLTLLSGDESKLYIVPDGVLHKLPFEALKFNNEYLIRSYSIEYLYASSLSTIGQSKNEYLSYAGFGTNYSESLHRDLLKSKAISVNNTLTRFNLSEEEISLAKNIFKGLSYLNSNATLSNFIKQSVEKDIIHLSLHGIVDYNEPANSCIVFDNSDSSFLLKPYDLYNENLNSNLVILSTCSTASGKIYNGEGVQGMSKAFIMAGTKYVISSLWNAKERTSKDILIPFLQYTKASNKLSENLRQAKIDYLEKSIPSLRHPFYWSNYILIGQMEQNTTDFGFYKILLFVFIALTALFIFQKKTS